ncbi:MAG: HAMP domain-containing histidine kinase [Zoogloeaceae bacterium]|jgi:signal transduction histidine kinase|nr:HAMP domain-containing histidine kinase [Zoogloeaceae bacterium]
MATERRRQPFARRIAVAFTLMTFVVSGTLSLGIVYVVHSVEKRLVSQTLDRTLTRVLDEYLRHGGAPRLDLNMQFFASDRPEYAIPEEFARARLGLGFSETGEGDNYWVYIREVNGQRYMLVEDQHEFEAHEKALFTILFCGFLLTVAGAWMLGRLMSKRIMAPVSRLAEQVRGLQRVPPAAPLAQDYADDEIGHLAEAFDNALSRLNLAMERERLFTSDVSHELRTPLMVIATSCELLETAGISGRGREQTGRIARAAEEMRNLVETFLTLARSHPDAASSGRIAMENGVTLVAVAREQCQRWTPGIEAKGLSFELSEEGRDTGRYNPALLSAVLGNLLRNALHYTERGWIRLALEDGGFRIEDSGAGIPEEEKDLVFQPFVRGARARGEGLGLGLSLVKRICAHQGWRIALDGLPEGGSRFRVRFR